ncbi:hypothetical protein [Streptomyces sp. NPDC045470]|uniref:hypothetical protein n=1 Tax=Streptomyces sp. NPDC045470 TaxID=3155469 RepID=UPI0033D31793
MTSLDLVQLAGILDDAETLGTRIKTLLVGVVLGVMYLVSVAMTWGQTKSVLKTVVVAVGGAAVLAIVANVTVLRDKIGEDIKTAGARHSASAPVLTGGEKLPDGASR